MKKQTAPLIQPALLPLPMNRAPMLSLSLWERVGVRGDRDATLPIRFMRSMRGYVGGILALLLSGCQVLTYSGSNGERLSRTSLGATTSISALIVETGSNGVRRVEMRGYQNNSSQALGIVTEAAVRAALQGAK